MPWTREEKYFASQFIRKQKSFKTVQAKFLKKFNFDYYSQKRQIYRWVLKFQATGSVNNFNKMTEYPRSNRKLTARSPD